MAGELGIPVDHGHGNMPPREKAAWINNTIIATHSCKANGANDSLALDAAYCRGTPVIHRGMHAAGEMMNPLIAAILMPANSLLTLMIVSSTMRGAFRHPDIKEPLSGQERG